MEVTIFGTLQCLIGFILMLKAFSKSGSILARVLMPTMQSSGRAISTLLLPPLFTHHNDAKPHPYSFFNLSTRRMSSTPPMEPNFTLLVDEQPGTDDHTIRLKRTLEAGGSIVFCNTLKTTEISNRFSSHITLVSFKNDIMRIDVEYNQRPNSKKDAPETYTIDDLEDQIIILDIIAGKKSSSEAAKHVSGIISHAHESMIEYRNQIGNEQGNGVKDETMYHLNGDLRPDWSHKPPEFIALKYHAKYFCRLNPGNNSNHKTATRVIDTEMQAALEEQLELHAKKNRPFRRTVKPFFYHSTSFNPLSETSRRNSILICQ